MTAGPAALTNPELANPGLSNPELGRACSVWFADLGRHLDAIEDEERRCPRLSADEIVRAERTSPDQRRLWRASHIALRDILERCCGPAVRRVPFASKAGGRPELDLELVAVGDGARVSFSLSHTADVALIAVSRIGPIGVDIEAVHYRAFPEARRKKIESIAVDITGGHPLPSDADRRFLQAWTRVEALSKADGRGVLYTLNSEGAAAQVGAGQPVNAFVVRDLDVGAGYCASIAGAGLPDVMAVKTYVPPPIRPL